MIPIRVRTEEEIQKIYPRFKAKEDYRDICWAGDYAGVLGKMVPDWNPDTIQTAKFIKVFDYWIARELIWFTSDEEKKNSDSIELHLSKEGGSYVLLVGDVKLTITTEKIK